MSHFKEVIGQIIFLFTGKKKFLSIFYTIRKVASRPALEGPRAPQPLSGDLAPCQALSLVLDGSPWLASYLGGLQLTTSLLLFVLRNKLEQSLSSKLDQTKGNQK